MGKPNRRHSRKAIATTPCREIASYGTRANGGTFALGCGGGVAQAESAATASKASANKTSARPIPDLTDLAAPAHPGPLVMAGLEPAIGLPSHHYACE